MANIEWNEGAIKDLAKLDKPVAQRILKKIDWLCNNFEKATPEPLSGQLKGTFKLRIGAGGLSIRSKATRSLFNS